MQGGEWRDGGLVFTASDEGGGGGGGGRFSSPRQHTLLCIVAALASSLHVISLLRCDQVMISVM